MDRAVLFDMLPVSNATYKLLLKIFSPKPERRPSLATIREEVFAMDTFFLTDVGAAKYGGADRLEKEMLRKMRACRAGAVARRDILIFWILRDLHFGVVGVTQVL